MKPLLDDLGQPITRRPLSRKVRAREWELRRVTPHGVIGISGFQIWGIILLPIASAVPITLSLRIKPIPPGLSGAIVFVLTLVGSVLLLKLDARRRFSERRQNALRAGRCPACWYTLSGIKPEPDGCTVCPECGAAWRVDTTTPQDNAAS